MPTSDFELEAQIILDGLRARGLNPDWVASLVPITTRMGEIVARFHAQRAEARNSGQFTARGLQQRLSTVADQARRDLTAATAETLTTYRTRIASDERQMVPRDPGGNEVVRELRAWEIRTRARDLDPLELQGRTGDDAQLLLLRSRLHGLKPKPVVEAQDLIAQVEQTDEFIGYSSRSIVEGIDMDVGLKMEATHAIGQAREHARAAEAEQARGH